MNLIGQKFISNNLEGNRFLKLFCFDVVCEFPKKYFKKSARTRGLVIKYKNTDIRITAHIFCTRINTFLYGNQLISHKYSLSGSIYAYIEANIKVFNIYQYYRTIKMIKENIYST